MRRVVGYGDQKDVGSKPATREVCPSHRTSGTEPESRSGHLTTRPCRQRPIARNGGFPSTAWYGVNARSQGKSITEEEGIRESIRSQQPTHSGGCLPLCRFLTSLVEKETEMGIRSERIVISGFSQGGAMALSMLRSSHRFAGIIGACHRQTLPLFTSHPQG